MRGHVEGEGRGHVFVNYFIIEKSSTTQQTNTHKHKNKNRQREGEREKEGEGERGKERENWKQILNGLGECVCAHTPVHYIL